MKTRGILLACVVLLLSSCQEKILGSLDVFHKVNFLNERESFVLEPGKYAARVEIGTTKELLFIVNDRMGGERFFSLKREQYRFPKKNNFEVLIDNTKAGQAFDILVSVRTSEAFSNPSFELIRCGDKTLGERHFKKRLVSRYYKVAFLNPVDKRVLSNFNGIDEYEREVELGKTGCSSKEVVQ